MNTEKNASEDKSLAEFADAIEPAAQRGITPQEVIAEQRSAESAARLLPSTIAKINEDARRLSEEAARISEARHAAEQTAREHDRLIDEGRELARRLANVEHLIASVEKMNAQIEEAAIECAGTENFDLFTASRNLRAGKECLPFMRKMRDKLASLCAEHDAKRLTFIRDNGIEAPH
jgi:DNA repair ATPase RecN